MTDPLRSDDFKVIFPRAGRRVDASRNLVASQVVNS
jgi:hypothetical protein